MLLDLFFKISISISNRFRSRFDASHRIDGRFVFDLNQTRTCNRDTMIDDNKHNSDHEVVLYKSKFITNFEGLILSLTHLEIIGMINYGLYIQYASNSL